MSNWNECKNILVIRADNMGDLIMSAPAINALKTTFRCTITVLASKGAATAVPLISSIDDIIVADLPWVKKDSVINSREFLTLIDTIKSRAFDGCVIFTVYSQSALPAALMSWMCNIPNRLAYCRENPYQLLTDWVPDKEPYTFIRHQVKRDMALVQSICAITDEPEIRLTIPPSAEESLLYKMKVREMDINRSFMLFHPGVSERKRMFPVEKWVELIKESHRSFNMPIFITGSEQDIEIAASLQEISGNQAISIAGVLNISELSALIARSSILVSVNTWPVHIASGLNTPVIVLYAQTNPQHTPWKTPAIVFEYTFPKDLLSKNEVIRYVNETHYVHEKPLPDVQEIVIAMASVIREFVAGSGD